MCNCLFPYFPHHTDTAELCLNYYLLLLCFETVLGVLLSHFPSLVTSISPGFDLTDCISPSVLLPWQGQCIHEAGAEDTMWEGAWEAICMCLTSRMVICCLSHIFLFPLCPLKKPWFWMPIQAVQLCLTQGITPAGNTSSRYIAWMFSRESSLFLTFLLAQTACVLFSHISKASGKWDLDWRVKKGQLQSVLWNWWKPPSTPGKALDLFFS